MAGRVSPGIFTSELQFADYVQQLGTTRPAIVGGATKGPLDTPTRITSEPDLIRTFGQPQSSDYGLLAAVQFLKQGEELIYLRVANGSVSTSSTVQGLTGATGGQAATGTVTFTGGTQPENGDTVTLPDAAVRATGSITFSGNPAAADEVVIDDGVNAAVTFRFAGSLGTVTQTNVLREVVIGATSAITASNLQQAIENAPVFDVTATVAGNILSLTNDLAGTAGNEAITETDTNDVLAIVGMSGGAASSNSITYEFDASTAATGTVDIADVPSDGDQVVLDDGVNPAVTFEFQAVASITENVQYREVITGASAATATLALLNAINAAPTLAITAAPGSGDQVALTNDTPGAQGNVTTTVVGADLSAAGMSGGSTAGSVGAGNIAVTIGGNALATATNLVSAIGAQYRLGNSGITSALVVGAADPTVRVTSTAANGTRGNVTITEVGGGVTVAGFTNGVDQVEGSPANSVQFLASSPGSWGDAVRVRVTAPSAVTSPLANSYDLQISAPVDDEGTIQVVENYLNVVNNPSSARFVEKVLREGIRGESAKSQYVRASTIATHAPASGSYTLGQSGLNVASWAVGDDGIVGLVDADYVGSLTTAGITTGLQALRDPELTEFNVLVVPGVSSDTVIQALLDTVTVRGDAVALIDPPLGLTRDQAVRWHNGEAVEVADSPTAPLDNYRATTQWPWFTAYSEYTATEIYMPPSVGALEVYARTDNVVGPWRAPAGFQRGSIAGLELEFNSRRDDRDALNGGGNRINPIANFQSSGLVLYGNRTLQRKDGPLDSVGVLRMLLFVKKSIVTAIQYLQFEPNDPETWRDFVQTVTPILTSVAAERGIDEFSVQCDEATNPPALRAQKTMRGLVFIRPTQAAEIIEVDFAIQATGEAEFSL